MSLGFSISGEAFRFYGRPESRFLTDCSVHLSLLCKHSSSWLSSTLIPDNQISLKGGGANISSWTRHENITFAFAKSPKSPLRLLLILRTKQSLSAFIHIQLKFSSYVLYKARKKNLMNPKKIFFGPSSFIKIQNHKFLYINTLKFNNSKLFSLQQYHN